MKVRTGYRIGLGSQLGWIGSGARKYVMPIKVFTNIVEQGCVYVCGCVCAIILIYFMTYRNTERSTFYSSVFYGILSD